MKTPNLSPFSPSGILEVGGAQFKADPSDLAKLRAKVSGDSLDAWADFVEVFRCSLDSEAPHFLKRRFFIYCVALLDCRTWRIPGLKSSFYGLLEEADKLGYSTKYPDQLETALTEFLDSLNFKA